MKKILLLVLALFAIPAFAELTSGEYFSTGSQQISEAVNKTQAQVAFKYSVAKHGGAVGAHNLGVKLPAKAIITRSYLQIGQQFAAASTSATIALHCETANNIKTATDLSAEVAGALVEGASTGAASAFKAITNECEIKATVATLPFTAGAIKGWVEYVIGQ